MTERLATFELFDDGTIKVLMRDRRYDVDTLAGVAAAAVAAADVSWASSEEDPEVVEDAEQMADAVDPPSDGEARPASDPRDESVAKQRAERAREAAKVIRSQGPYVCPECRREFSMPVGMATHRRKAHQELRAGVAQPEERLAASQEVAGSAPV